MTSFLAEYGLFLLKVITIVAGIVVGVSVGGGGLIARQHWRITRPIRPAITDEGRYSLPISRTFMRIICPTQTNTHNDVNETTAISTGFISAFLTTSD